MLQRWGDMARCLCEDPENPGNLEAHDTSLPRMENLDQSREREAETLIL